MNKTVITVTQDTVSVVVEQNGVTKQITMDPAGGIKTASTEKIVKERDTYDDSAANKIAAKAQPAKATSDEKVPSEDSIMATAQRLVNDKKHGEALEYMLKMEKYFPKSDRMQKAIKGLKQHVGANAQPKVAPGKTTAAAPAAKGKGREVKAPVETHDFAQQEEDRTDDYDENDAIDKESDDNDNPYKDE